MITEPGDNLKTIYETAGIPECIETPAMEVSELLYEHSLALDIGSLVQGRQHIKARYGCEGQEFGFDVINGQPYGKIPGKVFCSYIPMIGRGANNILGGLIYLSRRGGAYLIAEMMKYRIKNNMIVFLSPAGGSEKKFRDGLGKELVPLIPDFEEGSSESMIIDALRSDEGWAATHSGSTVEKVRYLHDYIGRRFRNDLGEIPEAAMTLYRAVGIPCLIIDGYCRKNGSPVEIIPGQQIKPNCQWNMIWVNGSWRFMDIARDITISHNRQPAYNDFLASPEWFGQNHVSISAMQYIDDIIGVTTSRRELLTC